MSGISQKDLRQIWMKSPKSTNFVHKKMHKKNKGLTYKKVALGAYKKVRDSSFPPYQCLKNEVCGYFILQKWPKEGKRCFRLENNCPLFDVNFPVILQNQHAFVVSQNEQLLVLDRAVKFRDRQDRIIKQFHIVNNERKIHEITANAWAETWMRDKPESDDWSEVFGKMTCLHDCPSCDFRPFSHDLWKVHAKQVKQRSARGSCNYTPRELLIMPIVLEEWLFMLLSMIEEGRIQWPRYLTTARVICLGKTEHLPTSPFQMRPITILSRLYRAWARYRSLQVIAHLQSLLPPQVAGIAAGIGADCMTAYLLDSVETAINSRDEICGVVADIVRCFNAIPRIPLIELFKRVGVPSQYSTALKSMLVQLTRFLEIGGSIGEPVESSTGIPEGCAFSVAGMIALAGWVATCIETNFNEVECIFYADNWGVVAENATTLKQTVDYLVAFVHKLRMQLAPHKSWLWGSSPKIRQLIKDICIDGQKLQCCFVAQDLGCDVAYGKKRTKKVAQKRWSKAKRTLKKVASCKLPKSFKQKMCRNLGSGIVNYGSELVTYSMYEWRSLRAAINHAVGRYRGGVNPFLSIAATGEMIDPELSHVIRSCIFWRRYFKSFACKKDVFFQKNYERPPHHQSWPRFCLQQNTEKPWVDH